MKIQTPAKINTQLYILKKRHDGFHDLYTHLVPVSLFDTITITPNSSEGMQLTLDGRPCGPHQENLVLKAARAFAYVTGIKINLDFQLSKKIPVGAGLGGGSGNAAGVLLALNDYYQEPLKISELLKTAASLGSDVPFFIEPRPSEATGRGEQLTPLPQFPPVFLLIVKPSFSISTAEAYRNCQPAPLPASVHPIKTFNQLAHSLHNQFELTLLPLFPQLSTIKKTLLNCGAVGALVSGSGSSVFGVFPDEASQRQAFLRFPKEELGDIFCCRTLECHSYCSE
ncbi:MAG: 4-(cytidine 5'-diphospho)-2-C-methyl-D-erythritol kinase [SAR324 cluster bacterium]|nr:4-(cytidine 5'-diphospho)-2-C-methyl-D-erythritol kinase [SAR324 cluster bacterium]